MPDFSVLIQNWYRQNRRLLPWRESIDPYSIWLSEVILQQTRVEQGTSYYLRFISAFPTVNHLAKASEDEVLSLWQGLGYYSRARNMHTAAKTIVEKHDGIFPADYKSILDLKGVGDYTAAAIASISYDLPHAVVDGNVYRVLARYLKINTPIDTSAGKKLFAKIAHELLDTENPGIHNQALMEIGALVCTPKNPKCQKCPISEKCMSFEDHSQPDYPVKAKKTKVRDRFFHYLVVTDGQQLLLKKRGEKDIWQGLYDFPLIEKKDNKLPDHKEFNSWSPQNIHEEAAFTHILSHQKIHARFWVITVKKLNGQDGQLVVDRNELEDYPLPQLLIRYVKSSGFFSGN